ncbi:hypothetical protein BJ165DRAFT_1304830, partial [Panaeolus papilionaceus]
EKKPNADAPDKGMLAFVKTISCCRRVITKVYRNVLSARRTAIKKSDVCPAAQSVLLKWRVETHSRDFPHAMHSPAAILPDLLIEILASIGPVNEQNLRESLQSKWALYDQY